MHRLGWSDCLAQTQGLSLSAAVGNNAFSGAPFRDLPCFQRTGLADSLIKTSPSLYFSLVDEGWTHSCPQFWRSKKNLNSTESTQFIELYFGVSEQIKPLQPIVHAA